MDTDKKQIRPARSYRVSHVQFQGGNWISGKIGNLHFQAKVYEKGSQFGINAGNVSKLTVWPEYGPAIINYDRGWDIKPKNAKEEKIVDTVLGYCKHIYNGAEDSTQPSDGKEKR